MRRLRYGLAAAAAISLMAGACSSSSHTAGSGGSSTTASAPGGSGSGKTYTVGVLTDLTGPGSVTGDTTIQGIKAGIGRAEQEGYHIKYVVADSGTSLTQALTAAKTLVQQDHVFAVMQISVVGFAAAPYMTKASVPVVGADVDGPEWLTSRNMFSIFGYADYTKVQTTTGEIFKQLGATNFGGIAYSIEPASYDVVKSAAVSAQVAGLKVGYVNTQVPLGSTNMAPIALAMKSAGVDGIYPGVTTQTSFALVNALRQQGVDLKVGLMPTGYGGDLTGGGQGAQQAAQGLYFTSGYEPVEMNTPATQAFQSDLKTYAGVNGDPTLSEYLAYLSIDGFVQGLKAGGPNPTQASFINTMLGISNYGAAGLWGGHTISFAMSTRGSEAGADNCTWITKYSGTTFQLVPNMTPICGQNVPGKSV